MKKSRASGVIVGLLLGLFMAALDQTIVSTAMTTIIQKLGGLENFIWVYSAYMVAMVASTPILGKMSDLYGRKRLFLAGLLLFIGGSSLCGTAFSMEQLIIYRAIQGIGGGAIMPIVITIIFDLFPAEKRGKMMGLFGAVFGLSSVLGPIMGGVITDTISWRWIFYINVPIGIISVLFVLFNYHETRISKKQSIDWSGAIMLTGAILLLMFGLELGGTDGWAWSSFQTILLFVGSGVILAIFLFIEKVAKDPIVNLGLFRERLFTSSMMISFLYGGVMIVGVSFIPLFIQGVFHKSATETSTVLIPMMLGIVASSQIGGRIVGKFKFRNIMLVSALTVLIGTWLLGFVMDTSSSRLIITLYMIVLGMGIGVSFSVLNISTLDAVPAQYKGSAASLITFFRTIGSALGIAVFGAMQKLQFQAGLEQLPISDSHIAAQIRGGQALLDPVVRDKMGLSVDMIQELLATLANSISYAFQWSVLLPAAALIFALLMGRARLETERSDPRHNKEPYPAVMEPGDAK